MQRPRAAAFLAPTPAPLRAPVRAPRSCAAPTTAAAAAAAADAADADADADADAPRPPLSPRAARLVRQQQQQPIFDAAALPPPHDAVLRRLQSRQPPAFLRPSHLPLRTAAPQRHALQLIAARAPDAVAAARVRVLRAHPAIDRPAGALWPAYRARACWRDLTAFARVAGYLTVFPDALSPPGLRIMRQLYAELNVPVDAMHTGVHATADYLVHLASQTRYHPSVALTIRQAFDQLQAELRSSL